MSTEDRAQGGPELAAGSFRVTAEHEGPSEPSPLKAGSSKVEAATRAGPPHHCWPGLCHQRFHFNELPFPPWSRRADEVGATSKDVDPGFGGGPARLGAGLGNVGRQKREAADPALQRGSAD